MKIPLCSYHSQNIHKTLDEPPQLCYTICMDGSHRKYPLQILHANTHRNYSYDISPTILSIFALYLPHELLYIATINTKTTKNHVISRFWAGKIIHKLIFVMWERQIHQLMLSKIVMMDSMSITIVNDDANTNEQTFGDIENYPTFSTISWYFTTLSNIVTIIINNHNNFPHFYKHLP